MRYSILKKHLFPLLLAAGLIACVSGAEGDPAVPASAVQTERPRAVPSEKAYIGPKVRITEVRTSSGDFAELYNPGPGSADLGELRIGDSSDFGKSAPLPAIRLPQGGYTVVYGEKTEGEPRAAFSLSKNGDELFLFAPDGTVLDSVRIPALSKGTSWALFNGEWGCSGNPSPGTANAENSGVSFTGTPFSGQAPLIISEMLSSNSRTVADGYGAFSDYAEIFNQSGETVSLSGWYLSDREDELTKWAFPDVRMAPGEYLLVFLSGRESLNGELHASFSLNETESLYLYEAASSHYYCLPAPETTVSDVSVGPGGVYYRIPTPGFQNSEGVRNIDVFTSYDPKSVYISEVCSSDKGDWIELYNGGSSSVSLNGWSLAPDIGGKDRFVFKDRSIEPGGYVTVDATSHKASQSPSNAAFGISLSGEKLYLIDGTGSLRDEFETGMLFKAASSGRIENDPDAGRVFFASSTKGKKNSDSWYAGRAKAPVFSETELYQTSPFTLTLQAEEEATIYYSLDGSKPEISSKHKYKNPLNITGNAVIRAIAVRDGCLTSECVTHTYLFEEPHTVPVVCISLSPSDKNTVWSAKSKQSKTKVEREGYLSYYEADGRLGTEFPAGFKAKGAGTLGRAQASLSIHLRGIYGQSKVTYPFFKEYGWETFSSLVVRNSGQDYLKARMRDSVASRLCMGLNIDVSATHPCAVYVNGEYYGLYDFNEDQNADYLKTHYGVDPDTVEIIRFNQLTVKGDNKNWKNVISYAKSKDFKSDSVFNEFTKRVDTDYYMDYLVCSLYLCNSDMANQKYWHTKDNEVRWRAIFYDFDYAMGFSRSAKSTILSNFFNKEGTKTATSTVYTYLACALIKNSAWKQQFIERYVELICTTFAPERVDRVIDELAGEMEGEMARHIKRWGSKGAPSSVSKWHEEVESMRSWFHQRPDYELQHLKEYFHLSDSYLKELVARYS